MPDALGRRLASKTGRARFDPSVGCNFTRWLRGREPRNPCGAGRIWRPTRPALFRAREATMHDATCCEGTMTRAWHHAYAAWYDHREAGHRVRAAVFGWIADRLCNYA